MVASPVVAPPVAVSHERCELETAFLDVLWKASRTLPFLDVIAPPVMEPQPSGACLRKHVGLVCLDCY